MTEAEMISVSSDVDIIIDQQKTLQISQQLEDRVEVIWQKQKALKGDKLFNGIIFNAVDVSSERIMGYWMPYRYALAGYREPSLGCEMGIWPMAVNGITRCQGRFLIALRSSDVVSYPNTWELAPSGGIDPGAVSDGRLDGKRGILKELKEEVGIRASEVLKVASFAAVKDWVGHALELCYVIDVKEVIFEHFEPPVGEYSDFMWLHPDEWSDFVSSHAVVPMSAFIWTLWTMNR